MQEAFRLGGWGMYPTAFVGILLVAMAMRFAANPARGRLPVVVALSVLTFIVGSLGFVTGAIKTMIAAGDLPSHEVGKIVSIGLGESLHNVALAMCLLVIAGIATVLGLSRRDARDRSATAVDPHNA
jgi:hypothetical protein